ncbi:MAG: YtoQ family protein [Acidobacteriota bacterium]
MPLVRDKPQKPKEKQGPDRSSPAPNPRLEKTELRRWIVYLAGEIHTEWRYEIVTKAADFGLPVDFTYPVLVHQSSDDCGCQILGEEQDPRWRDHKAAKINAMRTRGLIQEADILVACFDADRKYRQWNAAFDAGYAAALGKAVITLHSDAVIHPLKEVDAAALAVASSPDEVVDLLHYVTCGLLPHNT